MAAKKKSAIEVIEEKEKAAEPTAESKKRTRTFRSVEVRLAEIDQKIAFHQRSIEQLEAKKGKIGTGKRTRKLSYAKVFGNQALWQDAGRDRSLSQFVTDCPLRRAFSFCLF
jgi:phage gp16-like protein